MARFRRWFRCPLCQRAGLEPAQLCVPAPRDSLGIVTAFRQDATIAVGRQIADFWQGLTLDGRLASGGVARN